ncbi:RNA recognition domain-containing protein [Colletotrichum camelliae]|nr:RNA recognition domain-containing protein [Colletotrichum camelliae]
MFFPQEDGPLLKAWLMKKLPEVSDTETDILADYVLALLASQEGDAAPIRSACESELPQFLNTDTAPDFVDELFRVIEYKSYLPGAPPPPKERSETAGEKRSAEPSSHTSRSDRSPQNGSRKRSYYDRGDVDVSSGQDHGHTEERAYKQPRRGQWDSRVMTRGDGGTDEYQNQPYANGYSQLPAPYDPHYPQPPIGPQAWLDASPRIPAYSQAPPYGTSQGPRRNRQKCRDFATKGYCARGSSCQYDHGSEPIWLPANEATNGPPQLGEFDVQAAAMMMSQNFQAMQQLMEAFNAERGGRGGKRGRQGVKSRRRQNRASFSAEGPVSDDSRTTIVVENIPDDHMSEESVRGFFSEFGTIEDISMQPQRKLAVVKYDSWTAANAAYRSPKVIFDNRFVRVFWHQDENEQAAAAAGADGTDLGGEQHPAEPEFDMEEFLQKQEEAQRLYQEKMQKKQELEKQRQELEQRQRELLTRHREEQQKLQAKLAGSKHGSPENPDEAGSLSSALRAQLAALEDEAKLLGLDPSAMDEPTPWYAASRGRGRGRGGSAPRGRGGFAPRGRGSYRGGYRGDVHAAYAAYSLDNRPKTVSVTGVDFTSPEKDEALRQYLLGIGEFTDINTTPSSTQVNFKDRKTAEKFYHGLQNHEIPGVDCQLELSWVATPPVPVKNPAENGASKYFDAMDQDVAIGNAASNGSSAITLDQQPEQQPEMDYDVADDDDWGVE